MFENAEVIELLKRVDQAEAGAPISVDIARCRRAATRRQAVRAAGTGVLTVSLVLVGCLLVFRGRHSPPIVEPNAELSTSNGAVLAQDSQADGRVPPNLEEASRGDSDSLTQAIAGTQYEADSLERMLQLRQARQRLDAVQRRLAELEAQPATSVQLRLQEEINLTAAIMLDYADSLVRECNEPLLAAAEYQHVCDHYPGTRWAMEAKNAIAKTRLLSN